MRTSCAPLLLVLLGWSGAGTPPELLFEDPDTQALLGPPWRAALANLLEVNTVELHPVLPAGWGDVTLRGLRYRAATLEIRLHGGGCAVSAFALEKRNRGPSSRPRWRGRTRT